MNTDEWKIEIKVKNNLLYQRIMEHGFKSINAFAEEIKISCCALYNLINLKRSPLTSQGVPIPTVQKIARYFNCSVDELFTLEQLTLQLDKNKYETTLATPELRQLIDSTESAPDPSFLLEKEEKTAQLFDYIGELTVRLQEILRLRFFEDKTLKEVGEIFDLSGQRIRMLEERALRKLRYIYKKKEKLNEMA